MIARRTFLATSATAAATGITATSGGAATAAAEQPRQDTEFVASLTEAADARATAVLDGHEDDLTELRDRGRARAAARSLRTLTSVHVHPGSRHHHDDGLLGPVSGSAVPLALELCFRRGGELSGEGLEPVAGAEDTYQLVSGEASYTAGGDRITFGPGNGKGGKQPPVVEPGERYTWLNGSLTPDGIRVLITGRSPLTYRMTLR